MSGKGGEMSGVEGENQSNLPPRMTRITRMLIHADENKKYIYPRVFIIRVIRVIRGQ
jgi:hypothetical protein